MTQWSLLSGVRVTKDGMTHMYAARSHSVKINLKEFFFLLFTHFDASSHYFELKILFRSHGCCKIFGQTKKLHLNIDIIAEN